MASALTILLLLGCWLAGRSGVSGQLPAPGPSISVSPSGVIAPGAAVTLRCQCRCEARRLFLYKDGIEIWELDAARGRNEFTIPSARWENGGVYMCRSHSRSEPPNWSYPSDIVRITIAELSYQKPSISLHPSGGVVLGGAVTVRCRAPYQNMRFLLYRDGNPTTLQDTGPAGNLAMFPIRNVSWRDAGIYRCYYRSKLNPFTWSHPSDPVELLVAEPSNPKPSISLRPSGRVAPGGAVTIRCECRCRGARVLLSKAGDPDTWRSMDPVGDVAEFPIRRVSQRDAGSYRCRYSTKWDPPVWSEPSDPVELVVSGGTDPTQPGTMPVPTRPDTRAGSRKSPSTPQETDPSLPRPSISLSPTGVTATEADVTIRCQGLRWDVKFFLHKAGDLNPQRQMDPAGAGAEFRIPSVGWQHRGSYRCSYRPRSEPFVSSQPSDPVQLVVLEPSLPKPSVSVRPTRGVTLGGPATIRCQARSQNATFLLYKDGRYWGRTAPAGDMAEFPVAGARWEDAGSYSCSYHTTREPVAVSHPSDPAWLVVRDYTQGNIVRLALSAGVLLALALILAEAATAGGRADAR